MDTHDNVSRVTLTLDRGFQFIATYPDMPAAAPMRLDEQPPLGDGQGPNPAALLATAVGNCLASSLLFCARKAHVPIESFAATAEAHLARNERGRYRLQRVTVKLKPVLPGAALDRLARCQQLFEDYCIVTESVRAGFDVQVTVAPVIAVAQPT